METKNDPHSRFACIPKALPDEPIFAILARDPAAPMTILAWADIHERIKGDEADPEQLEEARTDAGKFDQWRKDNHLRWRTPDAVKAVDANPPTPRDEIASLAGRIMSPQYGITSSVVVHELIESIAASNSGSEAIEAVKKVLGPYEKDAEKLAGFVLRSDREKGPNHG